MIRSNNLDALGKKMTADARAIELAWLDEAAAPSSPTRPVLDSEVEFGFSLSESQYAGAVQLILEEAEVPGAARSVISNRATLAAYRDAGIEPWEVVKHILSR